MEQDYQLFGLKKGTSSLCDLKKSYYGLATIVHPDKTTCNNRDVACMEMIKICDSYNRLKIEIEF